MQIGVPRELLAGETRVAASPSSVEQLIKLGFDVVVETQAGALASSMIQRMSQLVRKWFLKKKLGILS